MYLEISGRRTGKTKRLIDAAKTLLDKDYRVFIVSPSIRNSSYDEIIRSPRLRIDTDIPDSILKDISSWNIFYDEFDYCNNVLITDTGYYCTTARYVRKTGDILAHSLAETKDSLLGLLQANGYKYESHVVMPTDVRDIINIRGNLSSSGLALEMNNEFIKPW